MGKELENIIKSVFESRYLKRIQRSGTSLLLGPEIKESIVEHSFYTALFAITLQHLNPKLNLEKLLTMCIIHDLEEVRTGDLNQVNRLYLKEDIEVKAFSDMWKGSSLGKKLTKYHTERHQGKTKEAVASQDCDTLAELILEKEYLEKGIKEATEWMKFTLQRIKTKEAKELGEKIINERNAKWWEEIKNDIRKDHNLPIKDYSKP